MARLAERPGHRATTANAQAIYPFFAQNGLGEGGVLIGADVHGSAFTFDPFVLYERRVISNPNLVIAGEVGATVTLAWEAWDSAIGWRPAGTDQPATAGFARLPDDTAAPGTPVQLPQATQAGMILGTAAYMSPEQARGRAVDKRCDIWAFGCVLFEMLTGTRAFKGDDLSEVIAAVLRD